MKKKIIYAATFFLISIGVLLVRKIMCSYTKNQQVSSIIETEILEETEENNVETVAKQQETEVQEQTETEFGNQVDYILEKMTIEQKVAQLFIITPDALTGVDAVSAAGDTTYAMLQQYPVGGLVYFENNLQSYDQISEMLHNVQQYSLEIEGLPLFLAVDEEGGSVARISGRVYGVEAIEDMATVGASEDYDRAREIGTYIGNYLNDLGFNVNFAPCADVLTNSENTVVVHRSFGSNAALVAKMVDLQRKAMEKEEVLGVLKHFPGHGATSEDSHQGFAYIGKTEQELKTNEWIPFEKGIEEGTKMIMVGHIICPKVSGTEEPASLSYDMVTKTLREKMGFKGLVVTDALNMGAIVDHYTSADAAVKAIQAGVDLLLMPLDFSGAYQGVLDAVYNGEISEKRLNESLYRILQVKTEIRVHRNFF